LCLPATVHGSFMSGTLGVLEATTHTVSQASFGMMPVPLIGAFVAILGGAIGTLRHS
jgi:hypothetical protein